MNSLKRHFILLMMALITSSLFTLTAFAEAGGGGGGIGGGGASGPEPNQWLFLAVAASVLGSIALVRRLRANRL